MPFRETKNGCGSHGEPVVLEQGPDGRVARLKVGDNVVLPVTEW